MLGNWSNRFYRNRRIEANRKRKLLAKLQKADAIAQLPTVLGN